MIILFVTNYNYSIISSLLEIIAFLINDQCVKDRPLPEQRLSDDSLEIGRNLLSI